MKFVQVKEHKMLGQIKKIKSSIFWYCGMCLSLNLTSFLRKQKSRKFTEFVLTGWDTFDKKHKYSARLLVGNIGLGTVLTS